MEESQKYDEEVARLRDTNHNIIGEEEIQDHLQCEVQKIPSAKSASAQEASHHDPKPKHISGLSLGKYAATTPVGPSRGPSRRISLRTLAPLMRLRSQDIKKHPWIVALNSTRVKEKRLIEQGIAKFNEKAAAGIDFLIENGVLQRAPADVAVWLNQQALELSKKRLGEYLGGNDSFAQEVLHQLLQDYDFQGMSIDEAMRVFINDIRMPGEAQMLDRILNAFAKRFFETTRNENQYATEDTVYILSFSIMLLNTDLHNRNLPRKEKMRLEDFIRNNRGINAGRDLPPELLSTLYYSIKRKELRMKEGDMWESESLTFVAPRMSGWLEKQLQGQLGFCRFHRFWFVLTNGCLFYFSSPVDRNPRCIIILEAVMAIKGASSTEIILYSNGGGIIKSVKIGKRDKATTRGQHTHFIFRTGSQKERDEWVEAFQTETEPFQRHHRLGGCGIPGASQGKCTSPEVASAGSDPSVQGIAKFLSQYRSPRSVGGVRPVAEVPHAHTSCLAEGWMRRRSYGSRGWQRRYFMLIAVGKTKHRLEHSELHWYTTLEMAQSHIGIRGCQGSISLDDPYLVFCVTTAIHSPSYRLPEPAATVFEFETMLHGSKVKELISPEDQESLSLWLNALQPLVPVRNGEHRQRDTAIPDS